MHILRRLPILETPSMVLVAGETIPIRAYQIIVWVSLVVEDSVSPNPPILPAILDTGHNHNFSIKESQLASWAGVDASRCRKVGAILVNRQEVPLLGVDLWIHRNRPGMSELLPKPVRLAIPEGISVYPSSLVNAPRLPLMGLRGIVRNDMRLVIDETSVSLATKPLTARS